MKEILAIARYTFKENVRNRIFLVLVFFTVIILFVNLLLSVLGGEASERVLVDFGVAAIEFFSLLIVVFTGVNLLLEEMGSRTIYLVLVRPIPKSYYLLGRYFGLLFSVYLSMFLMGTIHVLLLVFSGWAFNASYPAMLLFSGMKIAIVGALAVFFSLFSTSSVSSLVFTLFVWLLGHFTQEVDFLINKIPSVALNILLKAVYYLIPNFQYFNMHDLLYSGVMVSKTVFFAVVYGMSYSAVCLLLAVLMFRYKEF